MPPKTNPAKLNPLQLRTLALLQELARHPQTSEKDPQSGLVRITHLPHAHGDHMHVGELVVSSRDASGFSNPAVWTALERKGLAKADFPREIALTADGVGYDTGLRVEAKHTDH